MSNSNTGRVNLAALNSALRLAEDEAIRNIQEVDRLEKQLAPYGITRMATDSASSMRERFLRARGIDPKGVNAKGLEALTTLTMDQARRGLIQEPGGSASDLREFEADLGIAPLKKFAY